ncbi:GAF domain-containing sensor histidine kinase [Domibacillus indicus]|uniref:GAF domain-containing sensor histidine kinase n=1 Tax=Domibacillus indicus TaxID=1437523 RepID=UPI000618343C|nr:ATP-binding protein [Domibacillus indicus]
MNRPEMIHLLTGVQSSKRNYYTELKRTVDELQRKNEQLNIMNKMMHSFNVNMSIQDMLKQTQEALQAAWKIDRLSLAMWEDGALKMADVYPENTAFLPEGTAFPVRSSLYFRVFSAGRDLLHSVQQTDAFFESDAFEALGLCTVWLFPLRSRGAVIGVLGLASHEAIWFSAEDRSFFQHLSEQAAVCIENARLYQEVLLSESRWESTFRAVADSIFVADLDGTILTRNDSAAARWPDAKAVLDFLPSRSFFQTLQKAIPHTEEISIQNEIYECAYYPLLDQNQLNGIIVYLKNITEKQLMQAQLIHSGQLAAIGEMAAGVAHELNNPLTAIIGNTQLLLRLSTEETKPLLDDIDECGKRCRAIIRSLLAFSRQEPSAYAPCSLNEAVSEALRLTGRQLEKQQIELAVTMDPRLPMIEGNVQQLSQIAVNLLINAKDACLENDGDRHVAVWTKADENRVSLFVSDNGCGMKQELLDDIFHPFFTTKAAHNGTGLGLSVSFGIAESHGGTLSVASEPGKGSTFQLALPILKRM